MKAKHVLMGIAVIAVAFIGYKAISDNSAGGFEKDLMSELPDKLTNCYFVDDNGSRNLDMLKAESLNIYDEITDGNYKSVLCTIELEGTYLSKTVDVTLGCMKHDGGKWEVQDFYLNAEESVVPKCKPSESAAMSHINEDTGFKILSKISEHDDSANGEVVYFYTVGDLYDYVSFEGDGVSCSALFKGIGKDNNGFECYCWKYITENNTEIVWDVYGTWHIDGSATGNPPFRTADITVSSLNSECGQAVYSYPCVDGTEYTGEYYTEYGTAYCSVSGSNPLDAKCVLSGINNSVVVITCDGVEGYLGYDYYEYTVTKY